MVDITEEKTANAAGASGAESGGVVSAQGNTAQDQTNPQQQPQPQQQEGINWSGMLFRALLFYFVYTTFLNPASKSTTAPPGGSSVSVTGGAGGGVATENAHPAAHRPMWEPLTPHSLTVYLSTYETLSWAGVKAIDDDGDSSDAVASNDKDGKKKGAVVPVGRRKGRKRLSSDARDGPVYRPVNAHLAWFEDGLSFGVDAFSTRALNVTLSRETLEGTGMDMGMVLTGNASVYAHVFLVRSGRDFSPDPCPISPRYRPDGVVYGVHSLTTYLPRPKHVERVNLLSGEAEAVDKLADVEEGRSEEWIPFFNPRLSVRPVADHTRYAWGSIPPQVSVKMTFDDRGRYWPVLYFDEFWSMREDLIPVNDTLTSLTVELSTAPIGMFKWQILTQMTASWEVQKNSFGSTSSEIDEFKRMLRDTNPYYLALTFVVSILHSVMEMMAFKNDVSFWSSRGKDNIRGLSVRTLGISIVMQFIILLYLLDNDTSFVVLAGSFVGVLIEAWKITRACKVSVSRKPPFLHFEDRFPQSMSETKKYDQEAIRYVSYVVWPLLACYTVYSLVYSAHKSWYSFILNTAVGAVYAFGFLLMTPQLYINYKLKSVAHLPWRTMTYKFLNTIIDDLFAFIITMPLMHRLACFRDDIIFVIYLYQRYIYGEDRTRVNEFGQVAPDVDKSKVKDDTARMEEKEGAGEKDGNDNKKKKTE